VPLEATVTAADQIFYDDRYSNAESAALLPVADSPLKELYHEVTNWVPGHANISDLGCGTGPLIESLFERGHTGQYDGIDFSSVAIREAWNRVDRIGVLKQEAERNQDRLQVELKQGDLRDWKPPKSLHNRVFVCLETLEHLDNDLGLVAAIPPGRRFIFSVPTFESASHVRYFQSVGEMWDRYALLLSYKRWSLIQAGGPETGVVYLCDTIRRADSW
jgi:trans-aconitate methyltransferase